MEGELQQTTTYTAPMNMGTLTLRNKSEGKNDIHIEEIENGYIITKTTAYRERRHRAKSVDEIIEVIKTLLTV